MTRFDRDTAVERVAPGRFRARLDPGWIVVSGPNGGYMAAVILRAIEAAVDDPERVPRSLTVHYAQRPKGEEVEIERTAPIGRYRYAVAVCTRNEVFIDACPEVVVEC